MLATVSRALALVWLYGGLGHANIVTPCNFNGTVSNSIDSQMLDDAGYFCLGPVGTLYEDENKVPSFQASVVLQESPKITKTLSIANLYTRPSTFATQVGTCDCVNQDVAWKSEHLPLSSDLAVDVIRKITESEPTLKKFDPASSGTPCDFTRLAYTWNISPENTDPIVMSMPPGGLQDVSLSGNGKGAATDVDFSGSPCGVVNEDPYQAKLNPGEPSIPRPSAIPVGAYCEEPPGGALQPQTTLIEQIYRYPGTTPSQLLQSGRYFEFVDDSNSKITLASTPANTAASYGFDSDMTLRYDRNKRMFFQTMIRYTAAVDFVCQCRQGLLPALVSWSGALNLARQYDNLPSELAIDAPWFAEINTLLGKGFAGDPVLTGASGTSKKPKAQGAYTNVLACPVVSVAKFMQSIYKSLSEKTTPELTTFEKQYSKNWGSAFDANCAEMPLSGRDQSVWTGTGNNVSDCVLQLRRSSLSLLTLLSSESITGFEAILNTIVSNGISFNSTDCTRHDFMHKFEPQVILPEKTLPPSNAPTFLTNDCTKRVPRYKPGSKYTFNNQNDDEYNAGTDIDSLGTINNGYWLSYTEGIGNALSKCKGERRFDNNIDITDYTWQYEGPCNYTGTITDGTSCLEGSGRPKGGIGYGNCGPGCTPVWEKVGGSCPDSNGQCFYLKCVSTDPMPPRC